MTNINMSTGPTMDMDSRNSNKLEQSTAAVLGIIFDHTTDQLLHIALCLSMQARISN